jgi:diamine N-acetyltransferase
LPFLDPSDVTLREITAATVDAVLRLSVSDAQRSFVATNAWSIAQAHFSPQAWFRAIHAGDEPVGFVMIADSNLAPEPEEPDVYFLWRFMIDARHQRRGYGRRALELLVAHVRTRPNATRLLASCIPGDGSPEPFYLRFGFARTGKMHGDEIELVLPLG